MKYLLGENVQIETFSDGECVVYDEKNEMMHVLNNTAYMALKIILECDEYALQAFVERNQELNQDISTEVLKSDFESILKSLLDAEIIVFR